MYACADKRERRLWQALLWQCAARGAEGGAEGRQRGGSWRHGLESSINISRPLPAWHILRAKKFDGSSAWAPEVGGQKMGSNGTKNARVRTNRTGCLALVEKARYLCTPFQ